MTKRILRARAGFRVRVRVHGGHDGSEFIFGGDDEREVLDAAADVPAARVSQRHRRVVGGKPLGEKPD